MKEEIDKLHIEIEMFNGEIDDVTPALIWLANELIENGTITISNPIHIETHRGNDFEIKWWFTEDDDEPELELPGEKERDYENLPTYNYIRKANAEHSALSACRTVKNPDKQIKRN